MEQIEEAEPIIILDPEQEELGKKGNSLEISGKILICLSTEKISAMDVLEKLKTWSL